MTISAVSWELFAVFVLRTVVVLSGDIFSALVGSVCTFPYLVSPILALRNGIEGGTMAGMEGTGLLGSLEGACSWMLAFSASSQLVVDLYLWLY